MASIADYSSLSDADHGRELRKAVTFAVFAEEDDLDQVTRIVDSLFTQLEKTYTSK